MRNGSAPHTPQQQPPEEDGAQRDTILQQYWNGSPEPRSAVQSHKRQYSLQQEVSLIHRLDSEESDEVRSELSQYEDLSAQNSARKIQEPVVQPIGLNLKQIFYSQCLITKMKLPKGHKGCDVPISQIYDRMVKENVPQSHWQQYI